MKSWLLLWALSAVLCGQSTPQFIWEGQVDGIAVLHIRGNRVEVQVTQGAPVVPQRFRFFSRLPDSRQNVELEVVEGRGSVRVTEQPRLENNYTASVTIEDRQSGPSFYSIALRWETDRGSFGGNSRDRVDRLTWSGRVDGEIVVRCRNDYCESETVSGAPALRERFRFSRRLPDHDTRVWLDGTGGRGDVRITEQPSMRNNFTASVRIRDDQGGSADYSFVLSWRRPPRNESDQSFSPRGVTWWGRVDDRVRVIVHGRQVQSQVVSGQPVSRERTNFDRALPDRGYVSPVLKKVRGRGRVDIIEFPSNRNGYRLVFEIRDPDGGADDYQVEVAW